MWDSGYQIRVREPRAKERIFPLEHKAIRIERAIGQVPSSKVLILEDPAVSRHHATLKWQMLDKAFLLVHESKTNATVVNGESFRSILLAPNDVIHLGDTNLRLEAIQEGKISDAQDTSKEKSIRDSSKKGKVENSLCEKTPQAAPKEKEGVQKRVLKPAEKFVWKPPEDR